VSLVSVSRWRSMGRIVSSWCSSSQGVVRNVPNMILTALFWTICSFFTNITCFPLYHNWQPYVSTGRQMALYANFHLACLSPLIKFPSSCSTLRDAQAQLHMIFMWCDQLRCASKKKPRYWRVFAAWTW
jgi:hypothetical protein